jgi:hypothetical protein
VHERRQLGTREVVPYAAHIVLIEYVSLHDIHVDTGETYKQKFVYFKHIYMLKSGNTIKCP